ncbi:hypothetical protein HYV11_03285 [Candidatus Dependentiae bacterium]|nr:hypothetical protein [Candidatus Dependentiae bacterium]
MVKVRKGVLFSSVLFLLFFQNRGEGEGVVVPEAESLGQARLIKEIPKPLLELNQRHFLALNELGKREKLAVQNIGKTNLESFEKEKAIKDIREKYNNEFKKLYEQQIKEKEILAEKLKSDDVASKSELKIPAESLKAVEEKMSQDALQQQNSREEAIFDEIKKSLERLRNDLKVQSEKIKLSEIKPILQEKIGLLKDQIKSLDDEKKKIALEIVLTHVSDFVENLSVFEKIHNSAVRLNNSIFSLLDKDELGDYNTKVTSATHIVTEIKEEALKLLRAGKFADTSSNNKMKRNIMLGMVGLVLAITAIIETIAHA